MNSHDKDAGVVTVKKIIQQKHEKLEKYIKEVLDQEPNNQDALEVQNMVCMVLCLKTRGKQ